MYYNLKKSLEFWVKDIQDEKTKNDYIKYRRMEKICDYLCRRISKQYVRKNLENGKHYRNKYDCKIYEWNGYCMRLIKTNGDYANCKFNKTVSLTDINNWVKLPL